MADMARKAKSVLVLDHHKTAQADLVEWMMPWPTEPNPKKRPTAGCTAYFDMTRSGARLAWDYFFPRLSLPKMVQFVEDYDLWTFALPFTREIVAAMYSYDHEFKFWNQMAEEIEAEPDDYIEQGKAILRSNLKNYEHLIENGAEVMEVGGIKMPVVNAPWWMASEVGNMLAKRYTPAIGATYWVNNRGEQVWSLRSIGNIDVSEIAKKFGGGGHRNAAGFKKAPKQPFDLDALQELRKGGSY